MTWVRTEAAPCTGHKLPPFTTTALVITAKTARHLPPPPTHATVMSSPVQLAPAGVPAPLCCATVLSAELRGGPSSASASVKSRMISPVTRGKSRTGVDSSVSTPKSANGAPCHWVSVPMAAYCLMCMFVGRDAGWSASKGANESSMQNMCVSQASIRLHALLRKAAPSPKLAWIGSICTNPVSQSQTAQQKQRATTGHTSLSTSTQSMMCRVRCKPHSCNTHLACQSPAAPISCCHPTPHPPTTPRSI